VPTEKLPENERAILDAFLCAPRFVYKTPRFLPRLQPWVLHRVWRASRRFSDLVHERDLDTVAVSIETHHYHPDRLWYVPSGWTFLRRALKPSEVSRDDVFVEFGCGKGRVVCQAMHYPFRRVVGLEISQQLSEIARTNVERCRASHPPTDVEIITADATSFRVPDDMTVAYFFNPFVGETFTKVIDNIISSLDRHHRRLRLIYAIPLMEDYILATGRFRLVRSRRFVDEQVWQRIAVYESV
jgi:predicted RNA methylase